jgi:hypothetical protein
MKRTLVTQAVALMLLVTAVVQWLVILERTWAAGWEWYKFHGYTAQGAITVGVASQALFYVLTAVAASIGFAVMRLSNQSDHSRFVARIITAGISALVIGAVFWTGMLLSPLVTFR